MKTIIVNTPTKTYNVLIGKDLLAQAGTIASHVIPVGTAAIVTDSNVDSLYGTILEKSLSSSGFKIVKYVIPPGEESKNPEQLISLLNFLSENNVTGSDAIFALGGGVVGDLAGFAAAIFLRGIKYIQLPTTLLAAVDSSVGGKTAIDLAAGKNLAGAFYQPDLVICDYSTLSTLSDDIFSDGCGEIIKYAFIQDESLLSILSNFTLSSITDNGSLSEEIISRCVNIKSEIVGRDERDKGERQLLNFGHTFAHSIEKCSGYTVSHGSAVAVGMLIMTRAAVSKGFCSQDCLEQLRQSIVLKGLPTSTDYDIDELYKVLLSDKKRKGNLINLVVPTKIGKCILYKVTLEDAKSFLVEGLNH